jgi:hypothetical protein
VAHFHDGTLHEAFLGSSGNLTSSMRAESIVLTTGVATIVGALLWLVFYITSVFPGVIRMCSSCTHNLSDQPPFNWGLGLLVVGIILVFVGLMARAIARPASKTRNSR